MRNTRFVVMKPGGMHSEDCFYNDEPMPQNCNCGLIVETDCEAAPSCPDPQDELTTLRARIKALESAQGARVPEGYVTVTDEMVERAAIAIYLNSDLHAPKVLGEGIAWEIISGELGPFYRKQARAALHSALGQDRQDQ